MSIIYKSILVSNIGVVHKRKQAPIHKERDVFFDIWNFQLSRKAVVKVASAKIEFQSLQRKLLVMIIETFSYKSTKRRKENSPLQHSKSGS
jgi:hypothetical protein